MWDQAVAGLFNGTYFSGNQSDNDKAFAWMCDLRSRKIGWKKARGQLEAYLLSQKLGTKYIEDQLSRAEKMMKPWLSD